MNLARKGEKIAALQYKKKGFKILSRNYICRIGEIDVVVQKKDLLVFCEVKTRNNLKYGKPYEAVDERKQKKLRDLANSYIKEKKPSFKDIRFDVFSILVGSRIEIEHIENAF